MDPDLGAELLGAEPGHQRQQQQHDACKADRVGEPLQRSVIIEPGDDQDEHQDADRGPDQLLAGTVERRVVDQVNAVDHDQAEAVEQDHARQDHRVGVRDPPPDCNVRECREQDADACHVGEGGDSSPVTLMSTRAYAPRVRPSAKMIRANSTPRRLRGTTVTGATTRMISSSAPPAQ